MRVLVSIIILIVCGAALVWLFARDWSTAVDQPAPIERRPRATTIPTAPPPVPGVEFRRLSTHIAGSEPTDYPFLADEDRNASISLGTVTNGSLINAGEINLPGLHHGILPRQLLRNLRFGTQPLITLLLAAAREVSQDHPDAILWLGNLSRRGGGDVPYSVSHNSGRDADIAFYLRNDTGELVPPPDLIVVGSDLTASHDDRLYRFDVDRNWALVRALLSHDDTQLQFLFVANHLSQAMLDHARQLGEPADLILRAETVLNQPGRRNPHDDHFHLRIYCSLQDVLGGCVNIGRVHPWIDTFADERAQFIRQLRGLVRNGLATERALAIRRLVVLRSRRDAELIADQLRDDSPLVRAASARAISVLGNSNHATALIEACRLETDPTALEAFVTALGELGGDDTTTFLISLLRAPNSVVLGDTEFDLRVRVVDALANMVASEAVGDLIELLTVDDVLLRARATWALNRITNTRFGRDWNDPDLDRATRHAGMNAWYDWLHQHGAESRESWLISGFAGVGFNVLDEGVDLTALARATGFGDAHIRYNAQRSLMNLLDRDVPSLFWSTFDAAWYWREAVANR